MDSVLLKLDFKASVVSTLDEWFAQLPHDRKGDVAKAKRTLAVGVF